MNKSGMTLIMAVMLWFIRNMALLLPFLPSVCPCKFMVFTRLLQALKPHYLTVTDVFRARLAQTTIPAPLLPFSGGQMRPHAVALDQLGPS